MEYFILKTLHILSAIVLFGTGLGSAFYKYFTDRSGDIRAIAVTNRLVVLADWLFTTPAIIIQPLTGWLLMDTLGFAWDTPWILAAVVLYALAGACWLPVLWLQIRMRALSDAAVRLDHGLADEYHRYRRWWFWLGVPAFAAMVGIVLLMVFKHIPGLDLIS